VSRTRAAVAALLIGASVVGVGCSSDPQADFCDRLRSDYRFDDLANAIDRGDTAAISKSLQELQDLADDAPKEIAIDLHFIVDTVSRTVRAVTNVTSLGGESLPPDLTELNAALAKVSENSQRVARYADRDCNLQLNR
jgi:hypothetical protein